MPGFAALPEAPYRLRPPAPGSGWPIAAPADVGIDPGSLEATVRAVARGEVGLLHSLPVERNGSLVLEENGRPSSTATCGGGSKRRARPAATR